MTINMYVASLAWLCLLCGLIKRKQKPFHIACMISGILLDIILVIYLQFSRDAVQTALSLKLGLLPQLHIVCSSIALILYIPTVYCGFKLARHQSTKLLRFVHIRFGLLAFIFRTLGFLLMFSLIK